MPEGLVAGSGKQRDCCEWPDAPGECRGQQLGFVFDGHDSPFCLWVGVKQKARRIAGLVGGEVGGQGRQSRGLTASRPVYYSGQLFEIP